MMQTTKLLFLMEFSTQGKYYRPRKVKAHREEIELVLNGRAILHHQDNASVVSAGDLIWHKSGDSTICSDRASSDYECLVLTFDVETPNPPAAKYRRWQGVISARQFAEDSLKQLNACQDVSLLADYLYSSCLLHSEAVDSDSDTADLSAEKTYNLAYQFMAQNYRNSNLSINHVANAACVSVSQLHSVFKDNTGQTPHQKIMQFRMEYAQELLRDRQPLKQITNRCGFETESGFCKAFKRYYGQRPTYYRNQKILA